MNGNAYVAYLRIQFLFSILGTLCIVFLYEKNFLTRIALLVSKLVFKKLILECFNPFFVIVFIEFVAMILLQIPKIN